jgi:hypothetical protein
MSTARFSSSPDTWLSDAQRRLLLVLLGASLALLLVAWLVPPNNWLYWAVLIAAPAGASCVGYMLGAAPAMRRLDRLLLGRLGATPAAGGWVPHHPSQLSAEARQALERAVAPALVGQLSLALRQASPGLVQPGKAVLHAARAILGQPQPADTAVGLLAAHLPALILAVEKNQRTAAAACTLVAAALEGQPDPALDEKLAKLLAPPARKGGRA